MRFAILISPESWYFRDLARAAVGRHELAALPFSRVAARVDGDAVFAEGQSLGAFDAVLVRTMPPGALEQVVFRMDALARHEAAGGVVLNPAKSVEAAVDKYLTSARLAAAGLPTPRTWVCQTVEDALRAFEELGGDVVLKPIFGGEGRGLMRLDSLELAQRVCGLLAPLNPVFYLQEFVPHEGHDLRLLLLGDEVFSIRRRHASDWRTNISRGAVGEAFVPEPIHVEYARRAAEAVGAPFAGVDLLPARDGRLLALEVNAVPGWKGLARTLNVDIAALVLQELARRVRAK